MSIKNLLLTLVCFFCFSQFISAQCLVKGTVYDALLRETLPGVEVTVKGVSNLHVVTNRDGSFSFDMPCSKQIVLFFEEIGYFEKTLALIENQKSIEVFLDEDIFEWTDRMIPINSLASVSFKPIQ